MIYEVRIPVEKFTHSAMSAVGGYRTGPVRGIVELPVEQGFFETRELFVLDFRFE